jgi:arsenate reductase
MNLFIWYPKCSTCKRIKAYLDLKKINYQLRDIKEENPTKEELANWSTKESIDKFFNTSGVLYKELHLKEKMKDMTYQEKIDLLSTNGMLVKRPILITENQVFIGREIEKN